MIDTLFEKLLNKYPAGFILGYNEDGKKEYTLWCYKQNKEKLTEEQKEAIEPYERFDLMRDAYWGKTLSEVLNKALQNQSK